MSGVAGNFISGLNGIALGGLTGWNFGTILRSTSNASVVSGGNSTSNSNLGVLSGGNSGAIIDSSATGSVRAGDALYRTNFFSLGGLVGYNEVGGTITRSHANGAVIGGNANAVGGLVGYMNGGTITQSYATGTGKAGTPGWVGGLIGVLHNGILTQTFATGSATVGVLGDAGGLVGQMDAGTIMQSYAMGAATAGQSGDAGGLVAHIFGGSVNETYATGFVRGGSSFAITGGLYAENAGAYVTNSYWDKQTTGQTENADTFFGGRDGSVGLATAQLKATLPGGFSTAIWGLDSSINNGYPYLFAQNGTQKPVISVGTILTGGPISLPPSTIVVAANPVNEVYGSTDPALTFHIVSGTLTGGAAFSGSLSRGAGQNVGAYAIGAGTLSLPSNYTLVFTPASLTITPAALTYVANPLSRTYGALNPALSGAVSGFVKSDTLLSATTGTPAFTTAAISSSNVGTYAITGSGLTANFGNYSFAQASGNATAFRIMPASLTISAEDKSRATGQPNPNFTANYAGLVLGQTASVVSGLTFTTPATVNSAAGNYPIVPGGANAANYAITYINGNVAVTRAIVVPAPAPIPISPYGLLSVPSSQVNQQLAEKIRAINEADEIAGINALLNKGQNKMARRCFMWVGLQP